jgi:hypothetical protein
MLPMTTEIPAKSMSNAEPNLAHDHPHLSGTNFAVVRNKGGKKN